MENLESTIKVICIETDAFYALVRMTVKQLLEEQKAQDQQWISQAEIMKMLGIKSRTTLQSLRNNGEIRFSQPMKKVILYDKQSVLDYLDKHARATF